MSLRIFQFLLFTLFGAFIRAIPVDNGVEGEPEIECGPTAITVNFNTRNPFEGHVFVKGLYTQQECRNDEGGNRVAGLQLPFDSCNVRRTRSLNPRGVYVGVTVIITFHPQFITKVDRAYSVQCFYMEADKTVSADIEVSMLTTGYQTQLVPMPVCRYEILDGGPNGQPVKYVLVGQPVYHKWTCDTETVDTFCMTVHSCFVDDGSGDKVDLLDPDGCAQDRYLLRNLEYLTDLMAGQETHVFKYADRPQLFFQCQITITIKEPNQECPRATCPDPQRGKRSVRRPSLPSDGTTWDVFTHVDALDIDETAPRLDESIRKATEGTSQSQISSASEGFCLSYTGFGLLLAVVACVFLTAIVTVSILCCRHR